MRGRPSSFCVSVDEKKMNAKQFAQHFGKSYSDFYVFWKKNSCNDHKEPEILELYICKCENLGKWGSSCGCAKKQNVYLISSFSGKKYSQPRWTKEKAPKTTDNPVESAPETVTIHGQTMKVNDVLGKSGVSQELVTKRIECGWPFEHAIAYDSCVHESEYEDVKDKPPAWMTTKVLRPNFKQTEDFISMTLTHENLQDILGRLEHLLLLKSQALPLYQEDLQKALQDLGNLRAASVLANIKEN